MQKNIYLLFALFFGFSQLTWAQEEEEEEDKLGTQTVNVTKAYKPTISDAFKVKSVPTIKGDVALDKKPVKYSIFSVPVASTFTPAKGKAARVEKAKPEALFNSSVSVGLGNYNNALLDFYTSRALNRNESLDIGLNHHSSRGDVEGTAVNNVFYDTKLGSTYTKRNRDMEWNANVGFQHKLYSWYGADAIIVGTNPDEAVDEKQQYYNVELGGEIDMDDDYLINGGSVLVRRFWDASQSGENRAVLKGAVEIPIAEELVKFNLKADYVNGSFANADLNNTENTAGINYSHLQVGVNPSLTMLRDDLSLNLGINLVYGLDSESSDSNFYIYPAVTASYRLLDDVAIAYAGIEGELVQNSYYGFVEENPFVSPTLTIQPTDNQYDSYLGLRGQLLPNLSYNIKGSYTAENRKPLFNLNPENESRNDEKAYFYGNSFEVFYDDLKTLGLFAELNVDVNRNFTLGVNGNYYNYNTETDNPAWNLPEVEASFFLDYQIGEKWFMGANLFYVGERKDFSQTAQPNTQPFDFPTTIITLDSFFDANAHIGHRLSDQLSIFVRASNIANNNYQRWANFPVQGLQILGGATFKFDL